MKFEEFILAHDGDDLASLALARGRYASDVQDFDLALTTLEVRRKLRDKVPEWYAVPSLAYPFRLSGEQCSSTVTALYKAHVAMAEGVPLETHGHPRPCKREGPVGEADGRGREATVSRGIPSAIADLTGGLGVDSWAFSKVFGRVLYNEMRPELAKAAEHNFQLLGATNIVVRNAALGPSCPAPGASSCPAPTGHLPVREILGDFRPDILYLDPARRAEDGRKVFRLEDCQPDVLSLLPELLEACPKLLLKLSPMADITLVCKQLGCVKQVHVVAAGGECKELLLLLEKGYEGVYRLFVVEDGAVQEIPGQAGNDGRVKVDGQAGNDAVVMAGCDRPSPCFLFEPGKALLKAGAFDWPCRFGLTKLGRHTHLYIGPEPVEELTPFGKWFQVLDVLPLNKRSLKEVASRYPQADVTARNIPLTSDELRARLKVRPGSGVHIFGLHEDASAEALLYICARNG
ncbi:MAG: hypothetical protein IJ753_01785 [Bacteroidales bacterium]|nr:hypothetical protein [Bacteroidales bacterium]